ncbi:MAG: hypothetical protein U0V73_12045 [Acidimicrobiia bacterium]
MEERRSTAHSHLDEEIDRAPGLDPEERARLHEVAAANRDPVTERESLEIELMEEGESKLGEEIGA